MWGRGGAATETRLEPRSRRHPRRASPRRNGASGQWSTEKGEGAGQLPLWQKTVVLDEVFYESLVRHPLPVRASAIRALSGRSMAIDLHVWLAYRPDRLARPTRVTWPAL